MSCIIRYQEDGSATMRTPYDVDFIDEFKRLISWRQRTWDPDAKVWHIRPSAVDDVIAFCKTYYDDVNIVMFSRQRSQSSGTRSDGALDVLYLRPGAPKELIDAAYKTLARLHHPDKGGDTATMQAINAAYERIKDATG